MLGGFEKYAREGRIGLRAERLPVLPWECRKRQLLAPEIVAAAQSVCDLEASFHLPTQEVTAVKPGFLWY
jgi:hypothetical protein